MDKTQNEGVFTCARLENIHVLRSFKVRTRTTLKRSEDIKPIPTYYVYGPFLLITILKFLNVLDPMI